MKLVLVLTVALTAHAVLIAAQGTQGAQGVFRSRAEVVVIDAAVTDGRRPITNLTKDDFELRDNGVVQQILDFSRETMPLDVTVTIDLSGSMTPAKRAVVLRAIDQVSAALGPADRGAVVTFATRVTERTPLMAPPMAVDLSMTGSGTAVRDALLLSLVSAPVVDRRQFGLFMTDGEDTTSYFDARTVAETARHASGQTTVVIVRDDGKLKDNAAKAMFQAVASTTGGEVVELERGDDLSRAFLAALESFRTSYVLRYSPVGVPAPGWHEVSVRTKSRKYNVRARRGYWADAPRPQ
jgi:VWFA-related protein